MPESVTKALPSGNSITLAGKIKMKGFRAWVKAEADGDFDAVYSYLADIIKAWDFDGDPKDPAAYDELDLREYQEINLAVAEWLQAEVASKN
jgi:hypothetical protein